MTTLEKQIEEKRTLVNGMLKQAKGIAQEQWSNLSNDEKARLAGKKDQVVGKVQRDYGNSWAVRNSDWVLWRTAVTLFAAFLAFFITRKNSS